MKRSFAASTVLVLIAVSVMAAPDNAPAELLIVRQFAVGEGGRPLDMMGPPTMTTGAEDIWSLVPLDPTTPPITVNLTMGDSIRLRFEAPAGQMIEVHGLATADSWALMWDGNLPNTPSVPDDPDPFVDIGHMTFIGFMDMSMVGMGMGMPPMTMDGSNFNRDGSAVKWSFSPVVNQDPQPPVNWSFTAVEMTVDISDMPYDPNGMRDFTVIGDEGYGYLQLRFADPDGFSIMTPEPATVFILGAAALPLLRRRRRKRANT